LADRVESDARAAVVVVGVDHSVVDLVMIDLAGSKTSG